MIERGTGSIGVHWDVLRAVAPCLALLTGCTPARVEAPPAATPEPSARADLDVAAPPADADVTAPASEHATDDLGVADATAREHASAEPPPSCPEPPTRPGPDRDCDRVPDELDRGDFDGFLVDCSALPEDLDGVDDDDGCPDVLPIVGCQLIPREKIYFTFDTWTILPRSLGVLDEVVATLAAYPEFKLRVEDHNDDNGMAKFARKLSQKRADAIARHLIEQGLAASRVTAIGYGEMRPIDTNKTAEGRARNRRDEFWIVGCEPPSSRAPARADATLADPRARRGAAQAGSP